MPYKSKNEKRVCTDCKYSKFYSPEVELPNGTQSMPLNWYCTHPEIYDLVTGSVLSCKLAREYPPCINQGTMYYPKP